MARGESFDLRAAMAVMSERGGESAEGHLDEVPSWAVRPDIEGEWDVLGLPDGVSVDQLDDEERRSLEQAWMDGYERRREQLNRERGFGT